MTGPDVEPVSSHVALRTLVVAVAVTAGIADAALLQGAGHSWPSSIGAGVLMGAFVGAGVWWIRHRWERAKARRTGDRASASADATVGVARGGWANPTGMQRLGRRLKRVFQPVTPRDDEQRGPQRRSRRF